MNFRQRAWYWLFQQKRNIKLNQKQSIDTSARTLALFGHSFMNQHTAISSRFESNGFCNLINVFSGQRFKFNHGLNFGVSGEKSSDMLARLSTVVASCVSLGVTDVAIMSGANDRTAKMTAAQTIANNDAFVTAFRNAGIVIWFFTDMPRRDASYTASAFTAGEIITAKDDTELVNAHTLSLAASDLLAIDCYSNTVDTDRQIFSNLHTDNLHLNGTGAFKAMQSAWPLVIGKYGTKEYALNANNIYTNTVFSGTTGTLTGATGQLADGHLSVGTAPAGTASRVFSKGAGDRQVMTFNFPNAGSTTDNMRAVNRVTAVHTGKTAYYEVEIDLRNSPIPTGAGIWRSLSAELQTSAGSLSIGNDRLGTADITPVDLYRLFCIEKNRTMLIKTPSMVVPASTYIEGRVNIEANTAGGALAGGIDLLNEQMVVVA